MMLNSTEYQDPNLIRPPKTTAPAPITPIAGSYPPPGAGSTLPLPAPPQLEGQPALPFGNGVMPQGAELSGIAPVYGQISPPASGPVMDPMVNPVAPSPTGDPSANLAGTLIAPLAGQAPISREAEDWRQKFGAEFTPEAIAPEALGGSRREALGSLLSDFDAQALERDNQLMTLSGRRSAALGRIGSGMAAQDINQIARNSLKDRARFRNQLAADTIDKEFGDRFADRSFRYGVNRDNQQARTAGQEMAYRFGTDRALTDWNQGRDIRDEYRGERGYQDSRDAYDTDRRIQEAELQDRLTGSSFDRNMQRYAAGRSGNPAQTYLGASGDLSNQSDSTMQALMMYLQSLGVV